MSYYHLTIENRKSIERFLKIGYKISEISRLTGFHKSTISREVKRNKNKTKEYTAIGAERKSAQRRKNSIRKAKLLLDNKAYTIVKKGLDLYFSPEQISNTLPKKHKVCTSTIYRAIKKKIFVEETAKKLRFYNKKNKAKTNIPINVGNSLIKNISTRPKNIEKRSKFGHWELDTIVLRDECACHLATFVERKSRFLIMRKIPNKKAMTMVDVIIEAFKDIPLNYRKTLTVDNGMEFSDWKTIEQHLHGTKVYYCDPYSPWQRGTNENTNGLIRQFFPRKKLLPPITEDFVSFVEYLLNIRPRKSLNFKSPSKIFCCT